MAATMPLLSGQVINKVAVFLLGLGFIFLSGLEFKVTLSVCSWVNMCIIP